MTQETDESLRDFLERRERGLVGEIAALQGQLAPKEAELAEVRRAKGALGMPSLGAQLSALGAMHVDADVVPAATFTQSSAPSDPPPPKLTDQTVHNSPVRQNNSWEIAAHVHAEHERRNRAAAVGAATMMMMMSRDTPLALRTSVPQHLTMKELVIKALTEHFRDGASAKQLREFFRDGWGRDIPRENLSPQLTRLYRDKIVGRREPDMWYLLPANSGTAKESPRNSLNKPEKKRRRVT